MSLARKIAKHRDSHHKGHFFPFTNISFSYLLWELPQKTHYFFTRKRCYYKVTRTTFIVIWIKFFIYAYVLLYLISDASDGIYNQNGLTKLYGLSFQIPANFQIAFYLLTVAIAFYCCYEASRLLLKIKYIGEDYLNHVRAIK